MRARWVRLGTAALVLLVTAASSGDDNAHLRPLADGSIRALSEVPRDPDPAVPHRLARKLGPSQLIAAFYQGTRAQRLFALEAAAESFDEPFVVLPSLAALMGAKDRQVASRATRALYAILRRESLRENGFVEVVPGQRAQLKEQLIPLALDTRLDTDVRGVALLGVEILERDASPKDQTWLEDLLRDPDVALRRAAITALIPPLREGFLKPLARAATTDSDPRARGYAVALICENALSHGVEEPSPDLAGILKTTLEDVKVPSDALGGVLACISHFKGNYRADLADLALAHPDPAVGDFWKTRKGP